MGTWAKTGKGRVFDLRWSLAVAGRAPGRAEIPGTRGLPPIPRRGFRLPAASPAMLIETSLRD